MLLLPVEIVKVDEDEILRIDEVTKAIYRLIIYSRHHLDDDVLDSYLSSIHSLKELVGIKNAQMEAQNDEEAKAYLEQLQIALEFVVDEIKANIDFETEVQLFQLLRIISPETNEKHPNKYRQTLVQIGAHVCPEPEDVPGLMHELFYRIGQITNPIVRAIYLHHEMVRIHPFVDGNGRVTRIAKNWMLMFELYPPIFINDAVQKKEYIETLSGSFRELGKNPGEWNDFTKRFFEQEIERIYKNATFLYESIDKIGIRRKASLR
jgi:Fic family protein